MTNPTLDRCPYCHQPVTDPWRRVMEGHQWRRAHVECHRRRVEEVVGVKRGGRAPR